MSKLRYILLILFYAISFYGFSARGPMTLDDVLFNEASVKIMMDKSRGDFYVAVLDSTALLTKNDFPHLRKLVNQSFDKYLEDKLNRINYDDLSGDSADYRSDYKDSIKSYYKDTIVGVEIKDSIFASAYYKLYTHIANNVKSIKCNEPNLYKYFADSNPLTWQKSEDGVALFQDSL